MFYFIVDYFTFAIYEGIIWLHFMDYSINLWQIFSNIIVGVKTIHSTFIYLTISLIQYK